MLSDITFILQLATEEREENPDKDWFVARVEEKAKKLEEARVYTTVHYEKNDWIVNVRWYLFIPYKVDGNGDRFYKKGLPQWIPCGSIV